MRPPNGPKVEKLRADGLEEALDLVEREGRVLSAGPGRRAVVLRTREFTPQQQVAGRVELTGPRLRAGIDVREQVEVRRAHDLYRRFTKAITATQPDGDAEERARTALLRYGPACRVPWREALPGALFTAALWLLATGGFRIYLEVVAGTNPVLGAFGGGAIVMIWVFLLSLGLLLGGELNAVLAERARPQPAS